MTKEDDSITDASDGMIRIQPTYYEELLADHIRISALEQVHILASASRWGPGKFWIQGKGWFSKSVYGDDIRSTIDAWIALTVDDQEGS